MKPSTARRAGFTLIELLVVISIIALLVALLLPALAGARGAAMKVQCASNQRQLFLGFTMYSDEHKEYMMPARTNLGIPETYWCHFYTTVKRWGVPGYIQDKQVFLDPANPLVPFSTGLYTNYAINTMGSTNPNGDVFAPTMITALPGYFLAKRGDLKSPTKTIAFIDAPPVSYAPTKSYWVTTTTGINSGAGYWHFDNVTNIVLADGHVTSVTTDDVANYRWFGTDFTFYTKSGL